MHHKRCLACGQPFPVRPQVPTQSYCSQAACQRERRRLWQQAKRQSDPDYRDNQARAQRAWSGRNPTYWRDYRDAHPAYRERNRALQSERNQHHREPGSIAKSDASPSPELLPWGIYRLIPVTATGIAKSDGWIVEVTVLAEPGAPTANCKERT